LELREGLESFIEWTWHMVEGGEWWKGGEKKKKKYASYNHIAPYGLELKLTGDVDNQF
jgi:hypothetical protein